MELTATFEDIHFPTYLWLCGWMKDQRKAIMMVIAVSSAA